MEDKKLYKILVKGKSAHGGDMKWSLPTKTKPGKWHTVKGDLKICSNGLHLTTEPFKWYKWDCVCYEAEAKEIAAWEDDKCVVRSARLLRKVEHPQWWKDTEKFVKDISKFKFFKPDGKPNPEWKVFYGDTWDAARDAARDAAWDAARGAAWGAARGAAWDAAWGAARDAAWDAARDAAWDAARGAAWDAAWDAADDFSLYVTALYIASGLEVDQKHIEHALKRYEVWKKGYGLACDVNGVLYVYAIKK